MEALQSECQSDVAHLLETLTQLWNLVLPNTPLPQGKDKSKFSADAPKTPPGPAAKRSPYFEGLFKSGRSMREGGSRAVGDAIPIQEVKAGAFRVLLRFLYAGVLPEAEDSGEGLGAGELAVVADRFQALELFEHGVGLFRRGLQVTNVVQRLVQASHIASSFRPSLLIPLYA